MLAAACLKVCMHMPPAAGTLRSICSNQARTLLISRNSSNSMVPLPSLSYFLHMSSISTLQQQNADTGQHANSQRPVLLLVLLLCQQLLKLRQPGCPGELVLYGTEAAALQLRLARVMCLLLHTALCDRCWRQVSMLHLLSPLGCDDMCGELCVEAVINLQDANAHLQQKGGQTTLLNTSTAHQDTVGV